MALLRRCIRAWLVLGTSYTFKMHSLEATTRSSAEETKRVNQQTQRQPCGHISEATYGGRSVLRKVPPSPNGLTARLSPNKQLARPRETA